VPSYLCHGFLILALAVGGCAAQQSAIDPARCQSIVGADGASAAYTRCLLSGARNRTIGGVPVLSQRARYALQDAEDDPCSSAENATQADLLGCELARPAKPVSARERSISPSEPAPLPLVVAPAQ
jgi:hypothetical protein